MSDDQKRSAAGFVDVDVARRLSVSVVEDEAPIAAVVASVLRRRGHRVEVLSSVEQALRAERPDVLVCDVQLEGGSGLELLEELAITPPLPHAVLVTGMPTLADCRRAMQLGARDYLAKPYRMEDLVRAVERCPDPDGDSAVSTDEGPTRLRASYSTEPDERRRSVHDLMAFALRCRIQPATRARIGSACAEVIDNACRHAASGGAFHVQAERRESELIVSIADEGEGLDPLDAALDQISGRPQGGLARAAALCEDIRFGPALEDDRDAGGARVTLVFGTYPVAFDGDPLIDLSDLDYLSPEMARRVLDAARGEQDDQLVHLPPHLAVTVGRLLAGTSASLNLNTALWS